MTKEDIFMDDQDGSNPTQTPVISPNISKSVSERIVENIFAIVGFGFILSGFIYLMIFFFNLSNYFV